MLEHTFSNRESKFKRKKNSLYFWTTLVGTFCRKVFNLFTKLDNIRSYNTRQKTSQEYIVPRKRLATGQKSLAYIGVKIWESSDQKSQPF